MHQQVKETAFSGDNPVTDPYTGDNLVLRKQDAKAMYGDDWQNHLAEADHIDPLNKIANRTKDNPFLTSDDVKEIGNREDNFQVMSRRNNQGNSEVGKGGSSQEEWANDDNKMENIAERAQTDKETVQEKVRQKGEAAEKQTDTLARNQSIKNAAKTIHAAGTNAAINAGGTAATISAITNVVSVLKGEKDAKEAFLDTAKTGASAAAIGYVTGGGLTAATHALSYSSSPFFQALAKNNVPAQVLTAVMATGSILSKWGKGEISTQECILGLGERGLNLATAGYSMAIGQALIPIPIVGAAVGALVGSVLTSDLYKSLIGDLQKEHLEHQERMRRIAECQQIAEQARAYRAELDQYLEAYFNDYKNCFDDALSAMKQAIQAGDIDGCISSTNQITRKLGGTVKYDTFDEFKAFLDSDEDDVL